jgi:hypothetical protein
MSTYADMMTPVVDTAVILIEAARDVGVKAAETVRGSLPGWMPEPPAAVTDWIDLEDFITVSFDAAERVLRAERDASLELAKAVIARRAGHATPVVKAA